MGAPPVPTEAGASEGGKGCNADPAPCVPLNSGTLLLWWPRLLLQLSQLWGSLLHPFRLSLHSQQLSLPWVHSPYPAFQLPGPHSTRGHMTHAAVCRVAARTMSTVLTLSCLPQTGYCIPLRFPEGLFLSQLISPLWAGLFWVQEPLFTFSSPPGVLVPSCFLFSFFLPFILCSYVGIFLVLLGVRGLPLVFSRCSVKFIPFVDVFLIYLWGEVNFTSSYSAILTTPSQDSYNLKSFFHNELFSTYFALGIALGIWDTSLNKTDKILPSWSLHWRGEEKTHKKQ